MSRSLLPYHSAAPASPWLLNRAQLLPPTSVLPFSQSSSLLTSVMGFAPFLLLLRALLCHIPGSVLCLTSASRGACCLPCQAQPGLLAKGSWSLFSCTPGLSGRRYQLSSARCGNRGRLMAMATDLPCQVQQQQSAHFQLSAKNNGTARSVGREEVVLWWRGCAMVGGFWCLKIFFKPALLKKWAGFVIFSTL